MKISGPEKSAPPAVSLVGGRTIILASASQRRLDLLWQWGLRPRTLPATGVDEARVRGEARDVAMRLALEKAQWSRGQAISGGQSESDLWVIGADTVVSVDGDVLGKPDNPDHARQMLRRLCGREHEVITAVAVIPPSGSPVVESETSTVIFKELCSAEIEAYVASGDGIGKAGAYGIQSAGARLVAGFRGCYYNIVGLPVKRTLALLEVAQRACDCSERDGWLGGRGCQ